MSTDFIAGLSQSLLNRASQSIFEVIKGKLGDSSPVPDLKLTAAWWVDQPPVFNLVAGPSGQTFLVDVVLNLQITPDGGKPNQSTANATATARATFDGSGIVRFSVVDLSFSNADPFVLAVLEAKKSDIAGKVNGLIGAIAVPIGPFGGITFNGFNVLIGGGVAYAAGGLAQPVVINQRQPVADDGFNIVLAESLIQQVVAIWWNNVPKDYSASQATVHLGGYSAAVVNGQVVLTLYLGGSLSLGDARWDIDIDPVTATVALAFDSDRNLRITGGSVSRPSVSIKPANFWAWLATIAGGLVSAITVAILNNVVGGKIQDSINDQLAQKLMQIPDLSGTFEGITITVSPRALALSGMGNQFLVTGTADFSAH